MPFGTFFKGNGTVVTAGVDESIWLIIPNLQGDILCKHIIAIGSGRKIISTVHKRYDSARIDNLIHETCIWLADDAQKEPQFLYAARKAKLQMILLLLSKHHYRYFYRLVLSQVLSEIQG